MRRAGKDIMFHMTRENIALLVPRQVGSDFKHVFVSDIMTDCNFTSTAKKYGSSPIFPLYLYSSSEELFSNSERTPNLKPEIVDKIAKKLKLRFAPEKTEETGTFAPIDILDYIYAVLHSPTYRETYKEFLKIDFPRVPYPSNAEIFWQLVALGGKLRELHLLQNVSLADLAAFPIAGNNVVDKVDYKDNRMYINAEQYFDNVPLTVADFYIGGYQPARKWLKDRKGRALSFDDITHYQQMANALAQTAEIMMEIDKIGVE